MNVMAPSTRLRIVAVSQPDEREDHLLVGVEVVSGQLRETGGLLQVVDETATWRIIGFGYYQPKDDLPPNRELVAMERGSGTGTLKNGVELAQIGG